MSSRGTLVARIGTLRRALAEAGRLMAPAGDASTARAALLQMCIAVAAARQLEATGAWDRLILSPERAGCAAPAGAPWRGALEGLGPLDGLPGGETRALARIVCMTAHVAGLDAETLRGPGRTQDVVRARQLAMLIAAALTGAGLARIGAALGGHDHTTVLHGLRRARERLETSDTAALMAAEVLDRLDSGRAGGAA